MAAVAGRSFTAAPATLHNYTRRRLRGRVYPGIRKAAHQAVQGYLYHGLDRHALARLDAFEGEEYRRVRVKVMDAVGKRHSAYTYVIRARETRLLMQQDWDPELFVKDDLKLYLQRMGSRK